MNKTVKIAIVTGATLLVGTTAYSLIMKAVIRKQLDEVYQNPSNANAVGGLDKLLVEGIFDTRGFEKSGRATISRMEARERADLIWENYSAWLSSNSSAIISAFDGLGHIDDVSKIAHEFYESYDNELLTVLKSALGERSQYNILIGKLRGLPKD